jgi:hypothetical protein
LIISGVKPLVVECIIWIASFLLPPRTGAFLLLAFTFANEFLGTTNVDQPRHRIQIAQRDEILCQTRTVHIENTPIAAVELEHCGVDFGGCGS